MACPVEHLVGVGSEPSQYWLCQRNIIRLVNQGQVSQRDSSTAFLLHVRYHHLHPGLSRDWKRHVQYLDLATASLGLFHAANRLWSFGKSLTVRARKWFESYKIVIHSLQPGLGHKGIRS